MNEAPATREVHGQNAGLNKQATIELLAGMRREYRSLDREIVYREMRGYQIAVMAVCAAIEEANPFAMWTSLPEESELTNEHTLGDHVAVTRRALGLIA